MRRTPCDVQGTGDCLIMKVPGQYWQAVTSEQVAQHGAPINLINGQSDDSSVTQHRTNTSEPKEESLSKASLYCWITFLSLAGWSASHFTEMRGPPSLPWGPRTRLYSLVRSSRDLTDDYIILFCTASLPLYIPKMENIKLVLLQTHN